MIPGGQALRKRIERIDLERCFCNAQSFRVVHIHTERASEVVVATCHSTVFFADSRVVDTLVAGHIRDEHTLDIIRNFVSLRGAVGTGETRGERNPAAEVVNRHCREIPRQLVTIRAVRVIGDGFVRKLDFDRIRRGCRLEVSKLKLVGVDVFALAAGCRAVRLGQPSVCRIGITAVDRHSHRHLLVVDRP